MGTKHSIKQFGAWTTGNELTRARSTGYSLNKWVMNSTTCHVHVIWNRRGHECWRIWKLSADFTLIQCIKIVSIFLGWDMLGTTFLGSKLVSFNQILVPYEISKVNFRCAEKKILVSTMYVRRDLIKFENIKIT
jgi:hypothetical protein